MAKSSWKKQFEKSMNAIHRDVKEYACSAEDYADDEVAAAATGPLGDALARFLLGEFRVAASLSESPIETAMFWALATVGFQNAEAVVTPGYRGRDVVIGDHEGPGVLRIEPQFEVGKFRADFKVQFTARWGFDDADSATHSLLVECDGHAFHERTKEQAQRDKSRDRFLQASGFQVLRFTGSEIWADPFAVAGEVYEAVSGPPTDAEYRVAQAWLAKNPPPGGE